MIRDIQRYVLIAAIAVLGFMLLTNWVHFRQKMAQEPQVASTTELPTDVALPAANTDAAAIPNLAVPAEKKATGETAPTSAERYVRVRTDVLDLKIDLEGGDIVSVALPKYSTSLETPDQAFLLLQQDQHRSYIAQSGLVGRDGTDTAAGRPKFESATTNYELKEGEADLAVEILYETPQHVQIHKRFLFQRGQYVVGLNYRIDNLSESTWQGTLYGQLKRDNSADPSVVTGGLGMSSYLGAAAPTQKSTYEKLAFKNFADKPLKEELNGGWIGIIQHYFLSAWVPDKNSKNQFSTLATQNNTHIVRFTAPVQEIAAGSSGEFNARLYAGPKDQYALREIAPGLELSVDYGYLFFIAQPIFWLLTKIHGVLGNWGWSIVGVTVIVKAMFFWLNAKAYLSMANMRKVQPKLAEIRERYADDRQKQSAEMMNLYKTEKINPLGGCLPILVQMPVFLSLYWVLQESVELRHAPWILWINDLSAMDPYLILPLLMGATMFIQQKLNPPPPDPMQAKVMQWMPVMFTFFFLWFPAGLVLYWVVNNTLSIAQQYVITKRIVKNA